MPVVDFHIHPVTSRQLAEPARRFQESVYARQAVHPDEILATPERFRDFLIGEGVDYAVLLAEYSPITTGICSHEQVAEIAMHWQGFIPFCNVNPHLEAHPARALERLITREGFRGLKVYPTYQHFYPNDPELYPLYDAAQSLGIPVMIHTGSSVFEGARLKYGDPVFIDDLAVDFPRLTLLIVHGGRGLWYETAFFLARHHPNVYIDLAGLPPQNLLRYFPDFEKNKEKMVFGSDWPAISSIAENIRAVRALPVSEECKRLVLGETAARILGLGPPPTGPDGEFP